MTIQVYKNVDGLEKPDELASIIFQLYAQKADKAKVVLADLSTYDELHLISQQMNMAQTRELFKYGR